MDYYYYWILGFVIIVIVLYYLYFFIIHKHPIIKLNSTTSTILEEDQIENPDSQIYTYSMWVYAKKLSITPGVDTNIFSYGSGISLNITPNLHLDFSANTITDYFPMEQWVYVVICANKEFYDFYLDGKLVKSLQLNSSLPIPDNKQIIIGDNNTVNKVDIRIANFKRIPKALTHYEVAVDYEKNKYIKDYYKSPKYNLEISLNKGKINKKSYSLYTRDQTTLEHEIKNKF